MVPSSYAAVAVLVLSALPLRAAPVLSFEQSLGQLRLGVYEANILRQQQERGGLGAIIGQKGWDQFPKPDAATLNWLAQRIPNLDKAAVRIIPADVAEQAMQWAAGQRTTYIDLLTDGTFGKREIYFAPNPLLRAVDAKYYSGTMPFNGRTESGHNFQMQGIVAGQGRVHILYDLQTFSYRDPDGDRFKVENGGRVSVSIRGRGDLGVDGLSVFGHAIFCPWSKIRRMVKDGPFTVKVESSCGNRDRNPLKPVRLREGRR